MTSVTSEVIEALRRAPGIIVPLVREVPAELVKRRPGTGRWSVHEHACHLAEVQPMFLERLNLMLAEEHPTIRPYQPEQEHDADALLRLDLGEALERLVSDRARLVARLEELSEADWARTAEHEEYSHYSIFILFRHAAMHDMLHAYRIEELLLKRDWERAGG